MGLFILLAVIPGLIIVLYSTGLLWLILVMAGFFGTMYLFDHKKEEK